MTTTFARAGRLGRLLALLGAAAAALAFAGGGADPAGASCVANANAPYYDNGTIKAWGYIECSGSWRISAEGHLEKNYPSNIVDTDHCTRLGGGKCHVTPHYPNEAGDQQWCHYVEGGTTNDYAAQRRCEFEGF
ncbi:MAG TPA: hypothetical protein VGW75_14570 [Solirubrobacteraceae bacterium]|jgi:hypothetical protein|nr:hypothetical protein [Solirubrobacteraceae bacterium]